MCVIAISRILIIWCKLHKMTLRNHHQSQSSPTLHSTFPRFLTHCQHSPQNTIIYILLDLYLFRRNFEFYKAPQKADIKPKGKRSPTFDAPLYWPSASYTTYLSYDQHFF